MITIHLLNTPQPIEKDGKIYYYSHDNYDGTSAVYITRRNEWLLIPIK